MKSDRQNLNSGPILGHLIRLSIPASMGMIFNTLYNLTDFWFAGRLSDDALAGVSIASSVFFLVLAISIGIQTGASAVIAPEVGAGRDETVADWVDQVFGLSLLLSVLVVIIGMLVAEPLVRFLGAESRIEPLSMEYISITLWGSVTFILTFAAAGALMAMGDTKSNRNALAVGFFANLVLNPMLTFGMNLGVSGLALATVLIKGISAVYLYKVLCRTTGRASVPRFDIGKWAALLKQVLPAGINMLTIIVGGFITTSFIGRFGSQHIAGVAVGLRIEQVLLLPALGLNAAVMAMGGQNLGAGLHERVRATYITALWVGLCMSAASIPVMVFLSPFMMSLFSSDPEIVASGAAYLRIDAIAFYAYIVLFQSTAVLQALKQPLFPMCLGIARQLVLPAIINYWLIVYRGFPMISIFYTIITVVAMSAIIAHWFTLKRLKILQHD